MLIFFLALACSISSAGLVLFLTQRRQSHYRALKRAVENMSQLEHASLDRAADRALGAKFNRNINSILSQFRVAEQRGFDWEKAMDALDDSVCIVDESGRIVRANLTFAGRVGSNIQEIVGQSVSRFIKDKQDKSNPIADAIRLKRDTRQVIKRCRLGDEITLSCTPMTRNNGERQFIVVLRTAARVNVNREPGIDGLREVLRALPVAAFIAEPVSGKILEINPRFIETFGISSPGLSADDLLASDNTTAKIELLQAIQIGTTSPLSFQLDGINSEAIDAELSCVMRRNSEGAPSASLVMIKTQAIKEQSVEEELKTLLTPRPDLEAINTIPVGEMN
jgi:PAS domain S-box-containing protein